MTHQEEEKGELHNGRMKKKGGFITLPFIIVNESLEKMASYGLSMSMIQYLTKDYRMTAAGGAKLVNFWSAATNFLPIVGAFLADSFLGRFLTIGFGSIVSFLGLVTLWLTAMIPSWKPPPCNPAAGDCQSATPPQFAVLILAFTLMSIGAGGVRPCSQAFGADQVDKRENPKNQHDLETFFNWYYACTCFAVLVGLTVIVGIQDKLGWRVGFAVAAALMLISIATFFVASSLYVKRKPGRNLFVSFARVIVAACRNKNLQVPPRSLTAQYYHRKDSKVRVPSNKLRFLNQACLVRDPINDISIDGSARNPWRLTSVEEVEELKALIRVLPIWSSGIVLSVNTTIPFQTIQAQAMDRHLTSKFEIPAASYGMFTVIVIVLWVPVYDRLIIPLATKLTGEQVKIGVKVRMGVGLFFTFMATVISAIVEWTRRNRAIHGNPKLMSAFWLVPQFSFNGLAEAFNAIGQTEFYYSQFPKSMSSIATSLSGIGNAAGPLIANAIISMVSDMTKKDGNEGWLANDINKGHYDYYYWLLAALTFVSLFYYLVCSWAYGPCEGEPETMVALEMASVD